MPCTKAQFKAMRPKLETIQGLRIVDLSKWNDFPFIVNNLYGKSNCVSNLVRASNGLDRTVYPEFDEKIFLDACGYQSSEQKLDDEIQIKLDELSERVSQLESEMRRRACLNESIFNMREDINRRLSKLESQPAPEIDYSKIKTGSIVKLKGKEMGDMAVRVVLWDSLYYISKKMRFAKAEIGLRCFTFHHEGEYINHFLWDGEKIDFIAEVVRY